MKIKLIPTTLYKVEVDGKPIAGVFKKDDNAWNGLECLSGETGKIIYQPDSTSNFSFLMATNGTLGGELVSATPAILHELGQP